MLTGIYGNFGDVSCVTFSASSVGIFTFRTEKILFQITENSLEMY